MCGISGFEFTVIMIAAIIVLGPEKLPEVLRMFGKLTKQIRRWKGDLGDIAKDVQSSLPVDEIRREMAEGLEIDRARTRLKETESEIDALRSRLKAKVAQEEAEIDRAVRGGATSTAAATLAAGAEPTLDAPVEPTLDAPVEPTLDAPVEPTLDAPVEPTLDAPVDPALAAAAVTNAAVTNAAAASAGPTPKPLAQATPGASLIGAGVDDDFGTAPSAPLPSIKQAAHTRARASASVLTPASLPDSVAAETLPESVIPAADNGGAEPPADVADAGSGATAGEAANGATADDASRSNAPIGSDPST